MLFLSPLPAFPGAANSKYVGVYQSEPPSPDKSSGPSMGLSLGKDGTATFTEDYGKGSQTMFGHWVDSGSQVKVTFDAVEGKPPAPPMIFQPSHNGLQAVTWDHAAWGKVNPPLMKRASSNWHNKGRHRFL